MLRRYELQEILEKNVMKSDRVYYQPPENFELKYPCIIYSIDKSDNLNADDNKYIGRKKYTVILLDKDPDSKYLESLEKIEYSTFINAYITNKINHYVFELYF